MTDLERAATGEFPVFLFSRRGNRWLHVATTASLIDESRRYAAAAAIWEPHPTGGRMYSTCGRRLRRLSPMVAHGQSRLMPHRIDVVCPRCSAPAAAAMERFRANQPPSVRYDDIWWLVDVAAGVFAP